MQLTMSCDALKNMFLVKTRSVNPLIQIQKNRTAKLYPISNKTINSAQFARHTISRCLIVISLLSNGCFL